MVEVSKPQGFKKERSDDALVAQWIEHLVAVQGVAGSIPAKRTKIVERPDCYRGGRPDRIGTESTKKIGIFDA